MKKILLFLFFILNSKILADDPKGPDLLLFQGAALGQPNYVIKALTSGADVNFQDSCGETALMTALRAINKELFYFRPISNLKEIIKSLIAHGAKTALVNNAGLKARDFMPKAPGFYTEISELIPRSSV
ncbi:hypothetical protein A3F66_04740 [candidate division TM6 bacterium RIFCSPHIGHO2_12_FULL_32_22]|nr:MAG: hypothetical protein A3F66_04740 [candidate division TM6 bacterium RIFCSPHIGHO2_12_FULL_32_22]